MAKRTDDLVDRVTDRLDDIRDTTAGALSSDEAPSLRELGRVRRSLDDVEGRLAARLDDLTDQQASLTAEIRSANKSTTFPRKLFWMLVGGAAAALGTYLADPDRGEARRQHLAEEARTRANRASEQARERATTVAGDARQRAVGLAEDAKDTASDLAEDAKDTASDLAEDAKDTASDLAEDAKDTASDLADDAKDTASDLADDAKDTASDLADDAKDTASHAAEVSAGKAEGALNDVGPDDVPDDPALLEQRVKSQVMGHRGDVDDVALAIGDPGQVILTGVVPDDQSREALIAAVSDVNGVIDVQADLSTRN